MNNSIFSSVALFSIIILVGGGCLSSTTNNTTNDTGSGFIGSYADALALGESMKCTWSSPEGDGTTYIKGDKFYTETVTDEMHAYIVSDGSCSYIWSDEEEKGVEFCTPEGYADDFEDLDDSEDYTSTTFEDSSPSDVDVNCKRENIPNSRFETPDNVEFSNPLEDLLQF